MFVVHGLTKNPFGNKSNKVLEMYCHFYTFHFIFVCVSCLNFCLNCWYKVESFFLIYQQSSCVLRFFLVFFWFCFFGFFVIVFWFVCQPSSGVIIWLYIIFTYPQQYYFVMFSPTWTYNKVHLKKIFSFSLLSLRGRLHPELMSP